MRVTKQYITETAHRLLNHPGLCRFIHGHSYLWEVTVEADELDANGMVIDFKHLKKVMVEVLEPFDHALVLSKEDPMFLPVGHDERLIRLDGNPTAENFAKYAFETLQIIHPGLNVVKVRVWETATSYAECSC